MSTVQPIGPGSYIAPSSGRIYSLAYKSDKSPRAIVPVDQTLKTGDYVPWGTDNLFPEKIAKEARKNTIIPTVLEKLATYIYNGNFDFGTKTVNEDGTFTYKSLINDKPDIKNWFKNTSINRYFMEAALNMVWYANVFPQLTRTNNRAEIASIRNTPARKCRWGWPSDEDGLVETCYISSNWSRGGQDRQALPVIDPYYYPVESLKMSSGTNFIYPLSYPDVDNEYYSLASWDSVRQSGWLEVATKIAELKKAILDNQMSPKYMIFIALWYMRWKYDGYDEKSDDDRAKCLLDTCNFIEQELSGSSNAGKTITSLTRTKDDGSIERPFEIIPIESPFKDGLMIQDSQEASSHILTALGYDATLTGNGPGKQFGAGSGSDKSVAFNILLPYVKARQDLILQPLNFIRDYNGWDENIEFWFWNTAFTSIANNTTQKPA